MLPPEQAIVGYVDVTKAGPRIMGRLHEEVGATNNPASPVGPGSFLGHPAIPSLDDIDALAFAADEHSRTLVLLFPAGRFSADALRRRLTAAKIECPSPVDETPCVIPAPDSGRPLALTMPDPGTLMLSESAGKDSVAEPGLHAEAADVEEQALEARRALAEDGVAWVRIDPRRLPRAAGFEAARGSAVGLFSKALGPAAVAYATLHGPPPDDLAAGKIKLRLRADFETPEIAREQTGVLKGLSAFAGAMLGSGGNSSEPWSRVFHSGRFRHEGREAHAMWSLNAIFEGR